MMDYAVNWQTEAVQRRRQMKADREAFAGRISILDRNALLALALSLYDEMEEMRLKDCSFRLLVPGGVLISRAVASQVPSALRGLTSVFGMGTGGSLLLSSPEL